MKSKEELNALKEEVEVLNAKLAELTEEELAEVSGGQTGIDSQISAIFERFCELLETLSVVETEAE